MADMRHILTQGDFSIVEWEDGDGMIAPPLIALVAKGVLIVNQMTFHVVDELKLDGETALFFESTKKLLVP